MTKKIKTKQSERNSQSYETIPPDKVLLELHLSMLDEYSSKRNPEGLRKYLSSNLTAIGSAVGEFWTNPDDLLARQTADIEQIPHAIEIVRQSFKVTRFNDFCAAVWGYFTIRGTTSQGIPFENPDCQMTAVYCLIDGKLQVCHLHGSQAQQNVSEEHEPWPLHGLAARQHETAEKYRFLLDNSPVGIMQYDCDGYLKEYNAKFLKIFGTTAEKVANISLYEISDAQAREALETALKGRTGFYEDYYRSQTADKITPLKMITTPIYNSESRIIGGIAIVEDTSEYKITQDRLHYQLQLEKMVSSIAQSLIKTPLERIEIIIENALELSARFFGADRAYIFQVDAANKTISNTHEWCAKNIESLLDKYQNYPLSELPGVLDLTNSSLEYIHFDSIEAMPESMANFKNLLIADKVRSILLIPMLAQGKFIGLFGYDCVSTCRCWNSEEITLLKVLGEMFSNALLKQKTERQIRNSDDRYRFLSENINDIIWIFDVETRKYKYISPTLKRVFGYLPEELMQLDISEHLTPESLDKVLNYLPERLANLRSNLQTRYIEELDQIGKDGRLIHTELTQNWVINQENGHAEIIGITRDITERKEMEEQKRQFEIQRQQSLKADSLGRMAGSIAHHFNNQLQVVIGNLELMEQSQQTDDKCKRRINDAMRATQKAAEMSSMMLTYLGQHQVEHQLIDLRTICESVLQNLRQQIPEKHQLSFKVSDDNFRIKMNRDQLTQIIRHSVLNASEACSEQSGKIEIDIRRVASSSITDEYRFPIGWAPAPRASYLCLRILDDGCGIPEEDIEKTFDPFFSSKSPGRGLGLANVLGFMRGIGGGISLSSVSGHGSCFNYYFPLPKDMSEKKISSTPENAKSAKMILLIEDEETVRFITRNLLENFSYKVIEACDGSHAIEIYKALGKQIDLVICDLVMPGMDGWQTLSELRKINPDLPVILASGYDQNLIMRKDHEQQPQAYLSKPYSSASLLEAINQAISEK